MNNLNLHKAVSVKVERVHLPQCNVHCLKVVVTSEDGLSFYPCGKPFQHEFEVTIFSDEPIVLSGDLDPKD